MQDLMNRIKSKFVIADPQMIAEMELSLTNGLLTKEEKTFPQGCNMLKKFQDLEELQSTLNGFCPVPMQDVYVHGKKIYLSNIFNQLLRHEYLDDLKRVIERHRPAAELVLEQVLLKQEQHLILQIYLTMMN